jgi:hypothetical protein
VKWQVCESYIAMLLLTTFLNSNIGLLQFGRVYRLHHVSKLGKNKSCLLSTWFDIFYTRDLVINYITINENSHVLTGLAIVRFPFRYIYLKLLLGKQMTIWFFKTRIEFNLRKSLKKKDIVIRYKQELLPLKKITFTRIKYVILDNEISNKFEKVKNWKIIKHMFLNP